MKHAIYLGAIFAAVLLLFMVISPATALTSDKGNVRKGKFFFKKNCKTCHSAEGSGPELTPMSKTSVQWEAFFANPKHPEKPLTEIVEEKNLIHVKTFLIHHAADSDQPETCG